MKTRLLVPPKYRSLLLATLLVTGLLFSRALLSFVMFLGISILLFRVVRNELISVFKKPLLLTITVIGFFYLYLLFLNPDMNTLKRMFFHLSIISILCLGYYMVVTGEALLFFLLTLGVISTLPTLADLLLHNGLAGLYEKGQVAYTLMQDDHQRFSIWISGCLGLAWYAWVQEKKKQAVYFILYFSFFLLVFSVRTGWLFLLMITITGIVIYLRRMHHPMLAFWLLLVLFIAGTAVFNVPYIRNKIRYMQWEWSEQKLAEKLVASDATRRLVNERSIYLIGHQPLGYGITNAQQRLDAELTSTYPQLPVKYKWPFSQYFYWALTAGWIAGVLPVLFIFILLYRLYITRNFLTATWVVFIALTCIYESTLEMQYGLVLSVFFTVLLYLYESGLSRKSLNTSKSL